MYFSNVLDCSDLDTGTGHEFTPLRLTLPVSGLELRRLA